VEVGVRRLQRQAAARSDRQQLKAVGRAAPGRRKGV
jgi:hypothetical protein